MLLLFLALGFATSLLVKATLTKQSAEQELAELRQEVEKLQARKLDLAELLEYAATDDFAEKEARRRLNLQKEGEEVVVVFSEKSETQTTDVNKNLSPEALQAKAQHQLTNPEKWWRYFFGPKF